LARQTLKVDLAALQSYIKYSNERDIDFNYTLNPSYIGNMEFTKSGIDRIKDFLHRLYQAGVRTLTIALPSIMELVQSMELEFKIRASTICQITNVNKAMYYQSLGIQQIVVDESINRNFYILKNMREAFDGRIEVIVNQLCDMNCIYRMFHYNMISSEFLGAANHVSIDFFEHRCVMQQFKDKSNLMKLSWIRPEDLKYYNSIGINNFKLQGRHTFVKGGDPVKTVECYLRESHDGNLMDLLTMFASLTSFKVYVKNKELAGFLEPFYQNRNFCRQNCTTCNYCETYAKKSINYPIAERTIQLAKEFYNGIDSYKMLLTTSNTLVKKSKQENKDTDIEFDLD
jgi:collagenase-like PrtC family protease